MFELSRSTDMRNLATAGDEGPPGCVIVVDAVLPSLFIGMWHAKNSSGRYSLKSAVNPNKVVDGSGSTSKRWRMASRSNLTNLNHELKMKCSTLIP